LQVIFRLNNKDTPAIKATYSAKITVDSGLKVYMSANSTSTEVLGDKV
jgi:aminopeptidase N